MQIEKPKKRNIPAWVVILSILLGLGLLTLPFLASNSKLDNGESVVTLPTENIAMPEYEEPAEILKDEELEFSEFDLDVPEDIEIPSKFEVSEATEPTDTLLPEKSLAEPTSTLLTSFYGNVKLIGRDGEIKPEKNLKLSAGDTIEVGTRGLAVIQIEELYILRLKPNTRIKQEEIEVDSLYSGKERLTYRFRLDKGSLLGTTRSRGDSVSMLQLFVQDKTFNIQDSTFRIEADEVEPWIGVLRGSIQSDVEIGGIEEPIVIRALEKVSINQKVLDQPLEVNEKEWELLRETYDMNLKTAAEEQLQRDLSKRAGDFFDYVFDHGTFYTEDVGYTVRDFYEDDESGEVYLEAEYDVFPSNSFVGLYVLTRELDARNHAGLRFDIRAKPKEGYPERFYLELKSDGQIIHRFEITGIKRDWQTREINFFTPISTPINEVTLVFLNESIGGTKKGYIQMRNLEMIPLSDDQKKQRELVKHHKSVSTQAQRPASNAPKSTRQAKVTETIDKSSRVVDDTEYVEAVPYTLDRSVKIADEIPKVVSLDDL